MSGREREDRQQFLVAAYEEVCRGYERIDDFRAKLLGFLPAVSGALFVLLLGQEGVAHGACDNASLITAAGVFGAIVTAGLLCYEERGIQRCVRLATVGRQLEADMRVQGRFTLWPHSLWRLINEPVASGLIYSAVFSAWVYVAVICVSRNGAVMGAGAAFILGVIATRAFYWSVTWAEESPETPETWAEQSPETDRRTESCMFRWLYARNRLKKKGSQESGERWL